MVQRSFGFGWFASASIALGCSSDGMVLGRTAPPRTIDAGTAAGGAAGARAGGGGVARTSGMGGSLTPAPSSRGAAGSTGSATGGSAPSSGGAAGSASGVNAGGAMTTADEPKIPPVPATCPELKTGSVTVMGRQVSLWVGTKQAGKKGPLMFYWHGTGLQADQAVPMLGPVFDEIQAAGGVVASFSSTLGTGTNTGVQVWYTDDFQMADVILACAVAQLDVDTRRIYAAGCTSGAFQAGTMAFWRSSYLAGAMPDDGGVLPLPHLKDLEDPSHVPSLIATYGPGTDIVSFEATSKQAGQALKAAGGFAAGCKYEGGHCEQPPALLAAQWQFLKDHPFGTKTDPYPGGLPASFPAACVPF